MRRRVATVALTRSFRVLAWLLLLAMHSPSVPTATDASQRFNPTGDYYIENHERGVQDSYTYFVLRVAWRGGHRYVSGSVYGFGHYHPMTHLIVTRQRLVFRAVADRGD